MSELAPEAVEVLALGVLFLASVALCTPIRRWAAAANTGAAVPLSKVLLGALVVPLAVLILTGLLLWVPQVAAWLGANEPHADEHVGAWVTFWAAVLALRLVEAIARQVFAMRQQAFPVPDLIGSIVKILVLGAIALWILHAHLDLDVTPLLASTALLTAVVGFALQGVLGNLLSGMSLHIVRSVMPLDWIAVEGGLEGQVVAMNWRETRLRTNSGDTVIVPNSTLASGVVRNHSRPTPLRRHSITVGTSYSDAPEAVIEAMIASARSVPLVLADPAPSACLTQYLDFGINYELCYWTRQYYDRRGIDGDVGRMIWYQFKRRGIEIPFPMSDKLLNDFMAVVYRQRRMPPEKEESCSRLADLLKSDLVCKLLVDGKGQPLLNDAELADVATSLRPVLYTRGETVFRQGEAGSICYLVTRGSVRGVIEDGGKQANEFTLGPGAMFGEMSLMAGLPRTATIRVEQEVELLELTEAAFGQLLSLRPEIPELLSRVVAERAAANAAAIEKLKTSGVDLKDALQPESILKRFTRLIGFGRKHAPEPCR